TDRTVAPCLRRWNNCGNSGRSKGTDEKKNVLGEKSPKRRRPSRRSKPPSDSLIGVGTVNTVVAGADRSRKMNPQIRHFAPNLLQTRTDVLSHHHPRPL